MDTVERRARLLAKIKNLRVIEPDDDFTFDDMYESVFISDGTPKKWSMWYGNGDHDFGSIPDPTTPAGAVAWLELMLNEGYAVHFDENSESFEVRVYGATPWLTIELDTGFKSIPAAVAGAVDALALKEFPSD